MNKRYSKYVRELIIVIITITVTLIIGYISNNDVSFNENNVTNEETISNTNENSVINYNLESIPEYSGEIEIDINNNVPNFSNDELTTEAFEMYSNLDSLGRAGIAYANICKEIMPTMEEKRDRLTHNPTGWKQVLYDNGKKHLYERCHLIAWSLGNENNNEKNLITGTRDMNTAMIPYETSIANYIKSSANDSDLHVLYRVTPYFKGNNLVATGVQIEAESVEDRGESIAFNKFIYNVQEGFEIDYATGESIQK